jgi:transcriptional regulator GlxA family with amidase domain
MKRRELLQRSAAFGFMAAFPFSTLDAHSPNSGTVEFPDRAEEDKSAAVKNPLKPPAQDKIPVAFLVSEGAVMIDFSGPWEVFQDVMIPSRADRRPFRLFTVSETSNPIRASGGMKIVPDYTLETAPTPKVIVIPAQSGGSEAMLEWIRKSTKSTDVTMSVCMGATLLASTGLLSGKAATTHHAGYREFARQFPNIQVKRGLRFVEDGNLATSGGLSSGIDLALRVVERYYGREVTKETAYHMEYQGQGWMDPDSNEVYAKMRTSMDNHPLCAVCEMGVDTATAPKSAYQGKTYYFCSRQHKEEFDATPARFLDGTEK